nr:hypothetical protein KV8917_160068 [Klebsiella variicola]
MTLFDAIKLVICPPVVSFGDWMAGADLLLAVYSIAVGLLALHRHMQWNNFHPRRKSATRQPGHSSNPKANYSLASHKGGRSNPIYVKELRLCSVSRWCVLLMG